MAPLGAENERPPEPLVAPFAHGRAADIYAAGDGRVLRRLRSGRIEPSEPAAMRIAKQAGFPVPTLFAWAGTDMELERIDGVDMLALVRRSPWTVRQVARDLADLHLALRAIVLPAEDGVVTDLAERFGGGDTLVHGDLHPGNVMVTATGPVVIDWSNGGVGPADADAAVTWLLLTVGDPGDESRVMRALIRLLRGVLVREFTRRVGRPSAATVRAVADHRLGDTNFSRSELEAIRRFRAANG